jgi:hypothetical protein
MSIEKLRRDINKLADAINRLRLGGVDLTPIYNQLAQKLNISDFNNFVNNDYNPFRDFANLEFTHLADRILTHVNSDPIEHLDNSIPPSKLKRINEPSEGNVLAFDSATNSFKWITPLTGGLPPATENVSFAYLAIIDKLNYVRIHDWDLAIITKDIFTDKAVLAFFKTNYWFNVWGRLQNFQNSYRAAAYLPSVANDFQIHKEVLGIFIIIASLAIDFDMGGKAIALSITGSTIKGMYWEIPNPTDPFAMPIPNATISAVDTTFTSGRWGFDLGGNIPAVDSASVYLMPPMSPNPEILAIYEVEITGDGSIDNPFKPNLPSKLEFVEPAELDKYDKVLQSAIKLNKDQKVDRLALSWNAFIPTDENGIPTEKTALVFIFEQKERQPHLYSIKECLDEIEKRPKVKKHDKGSAKKEMFARDKRLMKEKGKKEKEVDEFLNII